MFPLNFIISNFTAPLGLVAELCQSSASVGQRGSYYCQALVQFRSRSSPGPGTVKSQKISEDLQRSPKIPKTWTRSRG